MITIQEISPPAKLSGLSSLLVSFPYNDKVVETLKTQPTYYYHKKDFLWEFPINSLSTLLDSLTFLDDIQLNLINSSSVKAKAAGNNTSLTEEEISSFKCRPFQHQIEAVNFMLQTGTALLLDGCGVGKTNEMIWYAETLKRRGLIDHCLVICGICSLRGNWEREIKKFSTESSLVVGKYVTRTGSVRYTTMDKRAEQLQNPIDEFFVIINVESLRSDRIIEAIKKSKNDFGLMLFDEAHRCGGKSTNQGGNLLKLDAPYKIAATGTLITNSPISAYMPLVWTGNDHATLTTYKSQYCTFGGFNNSQIVGYKNTDLLREEIEACSLRRTLYNVRADMPSMTIHTEVLEMDEPQRKFYEAIKAGVKEEADKIDLKAANILALTTRLRQATACPSVLTTQPIDSVKILRAIELIEELVSQNEKVVVLSTFKEPIEQLASKLRQSGDFHFSVNTGDVTEAVVNANVDKFQNDPNEQIFLGTFGKVGTGFTLNAAAYLICIDTPYTNAMLEQGTERIHRISNTRPAFTTILICEDSFDERVQQLVETKKELGEYLVDGKEATHSNDKLTDELRKMLRSL